jgi:hypothetical protein
MSRFVVVDEGLDFDIAKVPDPRASDHFLKPSGRGLRLIRSFIDKVYHTESGNTITLIKRGNPSLSSDRQVDPVAETSVAEPVSGRRQDLPQAELLAIGIIDGLLDDHVGKFIRRANERGEPIRFGPPRFNPFIVSQFKTILWNKIILWDKISVQENASRTLDRLHCHVPHGPDLPILLHV